MAMFEFDRPAKFYLSGKEVITLKAKNFKIVYTLVDEKIQKECEALRKMMDDVVYNSNPWKNVAKVVAERMETAFNGAFPKTAKQLVDEHLLANAPESVCECGAFKAMGIGRGMAGHSDWCPWSKP